MQARLLGSTTTPGRALYELELKRSNRQYSTPVGAAQPETALLSSIRSIFPSYDSSPTCALEFHSRVYSLPPPYNTKRAKHNTHGNQVDEELAWFGSKLVWSRGSTVYRTFSYLQEKQKVTHALFANFTLNVDGSKGPLRSEQEVSDGTRPDSSGLQTFGPFHTSQYAKWGQAERPRLSGKQSSAAETQKRCLVVLLEDWMHVYYPTGHNMVVALPFTIDRVWSIASGGLMLQRSMNGREREKLGSAKQHGPVNLERGLNLDATMELVLEELETGRLDEILGDSGSDNGRIYSLLHPSSEMRPVVRGPSLQGARSKPQPDRLPNDARCHTEPLSYKIEMLWVSDLQDFPLALSYDPISNDIVFWSWMVLPPRSDIYSDEQSEKHDNGGDVFPEGRSGNTFTGVAKRPSIARLDSNRSGTKDKRSSVGGLRKPSRALNRRVSFKPDVNVSATEVGRRDGLAGLDDDTGVSARIKAEGDLVRGLPHARRVSHGLNDADRMARFLMEDNEIGENTMMFGIERAESPAQADITLQEIYRSNITGSISVKNVEVFPTSRLGQDRFQLNFRTTIPEAGILQAFQLSRNTRTRSSWEVKPMFNIQADAALPVICTRPGIADLITLRHGTLEIVTSQGQTVPLRVPTMVEFARPEGHTLPTPNPSAWADKDSSAVLTGLRSVSGSRLIATLQNGTGILLDCDNTSRHATVNQVLTAFGFMLPSEPMTVLKLNILTHIQLWRGKGFDALQLMGQALLVSLGFKEESISSHLTPWLRLQSRGHGKDARSSGTDQSRRAIATATFGILALDWAPYILQALHMVGQECLLKTSQRDQLDALVPVILTLAEHLHLPLWTNYWKRRLPASRGARGLFPSARLGKTPEHLLAPADVISSLARIITSRNFRIPQQLILQPPSYSLPSYEFGMEEPLLHITEVLSLYKTIIQRKDVSAIAENGILFMVQNNLTIDWINDIPWSVALPIWEILRIGKTTPSMNWPVEAYSLIDRMDIAAQLELGHRSVVMDPATPHFKTRDDQPPNHDVILAQVKSPARSRSDLLDNKHKYRKLSVPNMRFTGDRRLWDVEALLQTTRTRPIKPDDKPQLSEEERVTQQENLVHSIGYRTISQVIGYSMFTLDSKEPSDTDRFDVPNINVGVHILPSTTTVYPEFKLEGLTWPTFHQGVAAGLSLRRNSAVINSSWIFFNRPEQPTPAFGGFLFGLGLTGYLRNLETWHLFPNLAQRQDHISVGLLLGMAASYAGSQDRRLTTMLSAGVGALLPTGSANLNTSPILQSASIFGLGLVHVGSGSHRLAETALSEIGRYDNHGLDEQSEYREVYAFAAACTFGMIMLGRGGRNREHDSHCVARLKSYFVDLQQPEDEGQDNSASGFRDTNSTAAGSVLALGLMYLRTGSEDISFILLPPSNLFELDQIRPDMLIVRTLSYNLIQWDRIAPNHAWLDSQFPDFVLQAWKEKAVTGIIDEIVELAYYHIMAGACFALGLKYAGTMDANAQVLIYEAYELFIQQMGQSATSYETKIKKIALRQGFAVILIAWALVVAGSGDVAVYRRFRSLHGVDNHPYSVRMALHTAVGIIHVAAGRYSFGQSNLAIAAMAIAFFPRYPSTMDDNRSYLQAWRHLWALAIEPRCIATADVETLKAVVMPMKTTLVAPDSSTISKSTNSPYLLDTYEQILNLTSGSPRYTSPIISVSRSSSQREILLKLQTVFVQRKYNSLDYTEDPKGNRSIGILANTLQVAHSDTQYSFTGADYRARELVDLKHIVKEFTIDPTYRGFLAVFVEGCSMLWRPTKQFSFSGSIQTILLDSLLQNRPEILTTHLNLILGLDMVGSLYAPLNMEALDFASRYYGSTIAERLRQINQQKSTKVPPLFRRSLLASILANLERTIRRRCDNRQEEAFWRAVVTLESDYQTRPLGSRVMLHKVPTKAQLGLMHETIRAVERCANGTAISTRDRTTILLSTLRKLARQVTTESEDTSDAALPTSTLPEIWTEASLTNALREWCK